VKQLPRARLAHLPTPVESLPRLSTYLAGPALLVKRDDQTGLAFGGNKTRKLELLCAAAKAEGADTLITAGAIQSNHCRQTAAAAALLGMGCILVLVGEEPKSASANLFLDNLLGAEIKWTSKQERDNDLRAIFEETKTAGRKLYLIPYGGSNPTGAAAYVYALEELLAQDISPDWIVFASSSGGTQAGLVAGAYVLGYKGRILGISVDERAKTLQERVAELAGETAELLGEKMSFAAKDILVNHDYLGRGYAIMGEFEREAIGLFAKHEGLLLDPVYTGRAAAGLIDLVRKGFFKKTDEVLFWHTGGTPALFADAYRNDLSKSS